MKRLSPTFRLSLSLAVLAVSLLLLAETLGLIPDTRSAVRDARQKVTESLAVQLSIATTRSELGLVTATLDAFVQRSPDVRSAAIRRVNGDVAAQSGDHARHWITDETERSTLNHVLVPILAGDQRWGSMEVSFAPPMHDSWFGWLRESGVALILFVAMTALITYHLVLRRALRVLDPRQVIPQRVKSAFDALSEGVLILDEKGQIVLSNEAFAHRSGMPHARLLGLRASELKWQDATQDARPARLPWEQTLAEGVTQTRVPLRLTDAYNGGLRTLLTNSTPVLDETGRQRGTLVTFNDITRLEKANQHLREIIEQLRESENEIKLKNEQLYRLASHDPLTECLNRRALFGAFETYYRRVREEGVVLSCVMVDIDHFKTVNDRFGHDVGDKVIKWIADVLRSHLGSDDLLCRYGGEEFCVVLSNSGIIQAAAVAQQIRQEVEATSAVRFGSRLPLTVSIGVSSVHFGARSPEELITQADKALYVAKANGRNQVTRWAKEMAAEVAVRPSVRRGALEHDAEGGGTAAADARSEVSGRLRFAEQIAQVLQVCAQHGSRIAVLSLVPDHYRRVHDTHGPAVAEALLDAISVRLREMLRDSDPVARLNPSADSSMVSRLGSDEFGIVLSAVKDAEIVREVVKRMFRALAGHVEVAGHTMDLDVTIGIAMPPQGGNTPELLLKHAAAARHHAHERGGTKRYQFYSEEMGAISLRREKIARELRRAFNADQLVLHYQPQQALGTGKVTSWEALLRWPDAALGEPSPMEFIPIAEETGLIGPLGSWVLRNACRQAKAWADAGMESARVAVNLSAVQLQRADIVEQVRSAIVETRLDPGRLELEVTESAIMHDRPLAERTLGELKTLGVRIAIDDFGTGYSSLSYIKSFPADVVKIDRYFLRDLPGDARAAELYSAIVDMARRLDLYVVAEGVETAEHVEFVRRMGCNAIQGYVLSAALPPEQAAQFEGGQPAARERATPSAG